MSAITVRSALRKLVRAKNRAFKGDAAMLKAARETIREKYESNAHAPPEKVRQLLEEVDEATSFLASNVVQAPLNKRGNYTVDASAIDESRNR